MIRSTVAHVDLAALQANFRAIQEFFQLQRRRGEHPPPPNRSQSIGGAGFRPTPKIIAVVKANAYGHGSERVALALEQAGATMLACADIEEGIVLRRAGVRVPILVFGALSVSDLDGLFEFALTPTISTPSAARAVQAAAARQKTTAGYHLKIDTGMNRLGFRHDNLRRTLPELLASSNLTLEGVYTHFATADEPGHPLFDDQRARFEGALKTVEELTLRRVRPKAGPQSVAARVQQRRAAARLARLVRPRPARACCSTASCRRRSRPRFRSRR